MNMYTTRGFPTSYVVLFYVQWVEVRGNSLLHVLYTCSLYDVGNPRFVYKFIIWCRKSTCCIHVHYMMYEIHVLYTCSLYDVGNPRVVYMFIIWCRKSTCCIHVHYMMLEIHVLYTCSLYDVGNPRIVYMFIIWCRKSTCCIHVHYISKIWSNFKDVLYPMIIHVEFTFKQFPDF
jgi:hypothetical protein